MNKAEIIEHVYSEAASLYGLKKGQLEHILKEYEIALINGLESDGEISLLNLGKLSLQLRKPRTLVSKFVKGGKKELPERATLEFLPGKVVRSLVASNDFEGMRQRVRNRKKPKI